jgi:hypothetical protein
MPLPGISPGVKESDDVDGLVGGTEDHDIWKMLKQRSARIFQAGRKPSRPDGNSRLQGTQFRANAGNGRWRVLRIPIERVDKVRMGGRCKDNSPHYA